MEMDRSEHVTNVRIGMLNARSIKNKEEFILESIKDLNINITVVTETWLQDTKMLPGLNQVNFI